MKECAFCGFNNEFTYEFFGQYVICYCPVCYTRIYETCKHEKNTPVKYFQDQKVYVKGLCTKCNYLNGSFIKQSLVDLENLRVINKDNHNKYHQKRGEEYAFRIKEIDILKETYAKKAWLSNHNEYLKSIEWQEKRDEVLKRDNYMCQACLKARATQVHHLSYNHWKQEPLFELVSICRECHELITSIDNKK